MFQLKILFRAEDFRNNTAEISGESRHKFNTVEGKMEGRNLKKILNNISLILDLFNC